MQKNIFGEIEPESLTIEQTADAINVSTATIRNWIKTGYLVQLKKGTITKESLDAFMEKNAGVDKLTLRANKLHKDEHNHIELTDLVKEKIDQGNIENLASEYESSLSNSHRNKEGVYYTPKEVISDMLKNVEITSETTFLDPCCGSGNFIIEALERGVNPENIYGFDVDPNAVEITKKRIFDSTGFVSENIKTADFLTEVPNLKEKGIEFDLIFTNPPWGKKLKKTEKERFAKIYQSGKSTDTSSLFLFASMRLLAKNGHLGFLVQEAIFNISNFLDTRRELAKHKIERLIDYGKPFKGILAKAQAVVLKNQKSELDDLISCELNGEVYLRSNASFLQNPKNIFNFWANSQSAEAISQVYALPHQTLEHKAKWALGIVTGNNKRFCIDKPKDGYVPAYKGSEITKEGLKTPSNFIPNDFSKYQQVAPMEFYEAEEKMIYKFISSNLVFYRDTEQQFILNSANLLIPSKSLGISTEQLCQLLNSDFMNWLFRTLFNTHKVLRGDLEQLPIHTAYFKTNPTFSESSYLNYLGIIKNENGTYRTEKSSSKTYGNSNSPKRLLNLLNPITPTKKYAS